MMWCGLNIYYCIVSYFGSQTPGNNNPYFLQKGKKKRKKGKWNNGEERFTQIGFLFLQGLSLIWSYHVKGM